MDPSLQVLLAEDNSDDALLMQRAFKRNGLMRPPHIVQDGALAIEYFLGENIYADRVAYPFPSIVILDLKMPRVGGFEVLEWLLNHPDYRVIPTIIWTSSSDTRDVKHAFCLGANAYLCKPTSFDAFVGMVGRMVAFWDDCLKPGIDPGGPSCAELKQRQPFLGASGR